jgi:hypothetical protein
LVSRAGQVGVPDGVASAVSACTVVKLAEFGRQLVITAF